MRSDLCTQRFRRKPPLQRNAELCLQTFTVYACSCIEVFCVNRIFYFFSERGIFFSIRLFTQYCSRFRKDTRIYKIISGRSKLNRRLGFYRHPVSQPPGGKPRRIQLINMIHITFDIIIAVAQQSGVAIKQINIPGYHSNSACPVGTVCPFVSPAAGRDDRR